jgi:hypothetical protein
MAAVVGLGWLPAWLFLDVALVVKPKVQSLFSMKKLSLKTKAQGSLAGAPGLLFGLSPWRV